MVFVGLVSLIEKDRAVLAWRGGFAGQFLTNVGPGQDEGHRFERPVIIPFAVSLVGNGRYQPPSQPLGPHLPCQV